MDADRHAAGIPSAFEYHRRIGGPVDPDVAAAHRWLDSFRPEDAPLQWRRMMGASGDRGKNIATVLQSPLGLGAQAAPNTVIPGLPHARGKRVDLDGLGLLDLSGPTRIPELALT